MNKVIGIFCGVIATVLVFNSGNTNAIIIWLCSMSILSKINDTLD